MNIQFLGAAGQVTGSMIYLTYKHLKLLIDCGQFQGTLKEESLNYESLPFNATDLDAIILTHAHIDHSGRVPLLVKRGFTQKIFCTAPTSRLSEILLRDSGKIHETETAWENKKRKRAGLDPVEALYTEEDAINALPYLYQMDYGQKKVLDEDLEFYFTRAGHLLGSASIVMRYKDEKDQQYKTVVFSGDLGGGTNPLEPPYEPPTSADTVIMEATYGGKHHTGVTTRIQNMVDIILEADRQGGTVLIPSFAVGRTQEVIFELRQFLDTCDIETKDRLLSIPIYIDSPLAIEATKLYDAHIEYMSETIQKYEGAPFKLPNLHLVTSIEGSIALNTMKGCKVIISASGMCEAGRITHHLKHNLWKSNTHVIFIGYQGEETLGRRLLDGEKSVKIMDSDVIVAARLHDLHGFSGHADEEGLLRWVNQIQNIKKIIINHGEEESRFALKEKLESEGDYEILMPEIGDGFEL